MNPVLNTVLGAVLLLSVSLHRLTSVVAESTELARVSIDAHVFGQVPEDVKTANLKYRS